MIFSTPKLKVINIEEKTSCDIIGEGKNKECNCNEDFLLEKAEEIFNGKNFQQLGKFSLEIIDNCIQAPPKTRKKRSGGKSEWNTFVSEKLAGCGKEGKKPCSELMKEAGKEWQEKKKQKGE